MIQISPNQFALPGMEEHAHPFAKMLTKGFTVEAFPGEDEFDVHHITAHDADSYEHARREYGRADKARYETGTLQWASSANRGFHPGEIRWVENTARTISSDWQDRRGVPVASRQAPGIAKVLYNTAKAVDFGQDTLPVHSQDLSTHGKKFKAAVGGYAHDNPPPRGYHPFEQEALARQAQRSEKQPWQHPGQQTLFNDRRA